MLNRILSILSAQWLIHEDTAMSYLPALVAFVQGQQISLDEYKHPKPFVVASAGPGQPINLARYRWELQDPSIPENSVAVIVIDGPICSWDSMDLVDRFRIVQANDRINAVLLMVSTPGGMVMGLDLVANTIKNLGKPTVAMTIGMTASAGIWITSAATLRIATSSMDQIGSIGTKSSITDLTGLFEKLGIKNKEFYATKSTKKDEQLRALKDGNEKPMQEYIDKVNEFFHQAIIENLKIDAESEALSGAIFFAQQAMDLGLIDEINTMDYALETAYQLGLTNKINSQIKQFKFN
jgi:signal peptide peptidase SppA